MNVQTAISMNAELFGRPPIARPRIEDCEFYQAIDIPGYGFQKGQWDLREGMAEYLSDVDFSGKTVLEVGTANGFVCFEMERRGAQVTGFDLAEDLTYDAPPYAAEYLSRDAYLHGLRRIRNAWWLAHEALGSKARVAYGHANKIPPALGRFDIGVLANVMQHLQDPIGALLGLASRVDETVIVTETDWMDGVNDDLVGMMHFDKDNPYVWYQVKPNLVKAVLKRMGFTDITVTRHYQMFVEDVHHAEVGPRGSAVNVMVPHFTVVGRRS